MQKTSRIRQLENRVPVSRLLRDSSAATTVLFAILAPVLIGAMGLAAEASYWRIHQNAMQHASDSAAMAAATNGSTNYAAEAKAVAAKYGFVDGVGNVTVTVTVTPTGCTSSCHYSVTISDGVPAMLSAVVGYHGNTKINGQSVTSIAATATSTATLRLELLRIGIGYQRRRGHQSQWIAQVQSQLQRNVRHRCDVRWWRSERAVRSCARDQRQLWRHNKIKCAGNQRSVFRTSRQYTCGHLYFVSARAREKK